MTMIDLELERRARHASGAAAFSLFSRAEEAPLPAYAPIEAEPMMIGGWLPRRGLVPLFGKAGIMKTFLALDAAVHIAAVGPTRPDTWRGSSPIVRRGRTIVYSAEDTHERLDARIWSIITNDLQMNPRSDDARRTRERVMVIAPLSMPETRFPFRNPQLFHYSTDDRAWRSNVAGAAVFDDVKAWNADLAADDEERIVMVVLDSITTCAGFELTDNEAAVNFTYWVNRASILTDVLVVGVAHSVKSAKPEPVDPEKGAADRLAGGFAWSANVRLSIEVRQPLEKSFTRRRNGEIIADEWWESRGLPDAHCRAVVVHVAKKNIAGTSRDKLWLDPREDGKGGFVDMTDRMRNLPRSLAAFQAEKERHVTADDRGATVKTGIDRSRARGLVMAVARWLVSECKPLSANGVQEHWKDTRWSQLFGDVQKLTPATGGIAANATSDGRLREGCPAWHLERLVDEGRMIRRGTRFEFVDAADEGDDQ